MYSKIPMPHFEWKDEDMSGSLMFFPFVGMVIGALVMAMNGLQVFAALPVAVRVILTMLIPLVVTGGIHVDGLMDTADAMNSFAEKEKKLEILKDPHIGAFAVISLVKWLLLYAAAITGILLSGKCDMGILMILGLTFVVSRCLSGLTSLYFKKAKKEGMLYEETRSGSKAVAAVLWILLVVSLGAMVIVKPLPGAVVAASFLLYTAIYRYRAYREFGGVTGDTAGYFLTSSEIVAAAALAIILLGAGYR